MSDIAILDLEYVLDGTIAAFLIPSDDGHILVESGPHSCWDALVRRLDERGLTPADVRHVLLTHIHFDHAGAAWALARAGATVHVHPFGRKHLAAPERLYDSARRIYGDAMESMWGLMHPIDDDRLRAVEDGATLDLGGRTVVAHHTPGHARHHIAWQLGDVVFTGDVAGARLGDGPVSPPCPPPDIDLAAWRDSIARLRALAPRALYLTHFGPRTDVDAHLDRLLEQLDTWAGWIRPHFDAGTSADDATPAFAALAEQQLAGLGPDDRRRYEAANPAWMSVAGLLRWWGQQE